MKISRRPAAWFHRALVLAGLCCLLMASVSKSMAAPANDADNALAVANAWLALIDAGRYNESYDVASSALREKDTQKKWSLVLATLRPMYGNLVSRKEVSHTYKPEGVEGLNRECIIITYASSFQKLDDAVEVVVLTRENGEWRGAGYIASPKPTEQPPGQQPESPTTTTTETHVTPPPQQQQ